MKKFDVTIRIDWDGRQVQIRQPQNPSVHWAIRLNHFNRIRGKDHMAFTITDIQEFSVTVAFTDARGNPAQIDGNPIWSVSDDTLLAVEQSNDGFQANVSALGPTGHAQVIVTADARIGEDVKEIKGILDIDIVASEAVSATITPSEPTDVAI